VDLWVGPLPEAVAAHLPSIAADTLAELAAGDPPVGAARATVALDGGPVEIALRRRALDRATR
jgi:hypothetical protein